MPIIETDDGELEVDADAIQLTDDEDPTDLPGVQDEINRVAGKTRQNARSSVKKTLKSDEEAFREVAKAHGYDFREDGRIKGSAAQDEVKQLKKRNAQLEQKAQKAEELEAQMQQARETRLENELLKHADGVKEDMKDLFLSDAKGRFVYDEDDDDFYPVDEDGNPQYASDAEDVISELQEQRPSMFKDRSANDGPADEPSSSGSGKKVWTAEEHANADPTQMDDEEFADYVSAVDEGRIE
jgi:hypothetical protein